MSFQNLKLIILVNQKKTSKLILLKTIKKTFLVFKMKLLSQRSHCNRGFSSYDNGYEYNTKHVKKEQRRISEEPEEKQ